VKVSDGSHMMFRGMMAKPSFLSIDSCIVKENFKVLFSSIGDDSVRAVRNRDTLIAIYVW